MAYPWASLRKRVAVKRKGLAVGLPLLAVSLVLSGCSLFQTGSNQPGDGTGDDPAPSPSAPPPELPRGGREIFPEYRLFGYSGLEGAPALGRLYGDLDAVGAQIERVGARYAGGRKVLPVYELITVLVMGSPGTDGMYRVRQSDKLVRRYLNAARRDKALLLLDIQPGRSDFLPELKHYEKFLKEPDVGVALDPEWAMDPDEVPIRDGYGNSSGKELNEVAEYLSEIVAQYDLPEKVMVFHQVAPYVVAKPKALKPHEGVVIIRSVDGIGSPSAKTYTWNVLTKNQPKYIHAGFKLFYEEDVATGGVLMTPKQVLKLRPQPEYILIE